MARVRRTDGRTCGAPRRERPRKMPVGRPTTARPGVRGAAWPPPRTCCRVAFAVQERDAWPRRGRVDRPDPALVFAVVVAAVVRSQSGRANGVSRAYERTTRITARGTRVRAIVGARPSAIKTLGSPTQIISLRALVFVFFRTRSRSFVPFNVRFVF